MARPLRRVLVPVFALILLAAYTPNARADYWTQWGWGHAANYPAQCLTGGTNILTSSNPDKHNVAASNACGQNESVAASLDHFDSAGRIIDSCNDGDHSATNYYQCNIQASTLTGDYWGWSIDITSGPLSISCVNKDMSYQTCFG